MQKYYKVKTGAVFHLSGEIAIPSLKRIFYTNCFITVRDKNNLFIRGHNTEEHLTVLESL